MLRTLDELANANAAHKWLIAVSAAVEPAV